MVVPIYPLANGRYSFVRPDGARAAVKVRVPAGSAILPTTLFGPQLFVPTGDRVKVAWGPAAVVRAAHEGRGVFRVV